MYHFYGGGCLVFGVGSGLRHNWVHNMVWTRNSFNASNFQRPIRSGSAPPGPKTCNF